MKVFKDEKLAKQTYQFMVEINKLPSINRDFDRQIENMTETCWENIYDLLTKEFEDLIVEDKDPMGRVEEELKKLEG